MNKQVLLGLAVSTLFFIAVYAECQEIYTPWVLRGSCNDTCGGYGVQKMIRACTTGCNCQGPFVQWTLCNANPCDFPRIPCGNGLGRVSVNGTGIVCGYTVNDAN
ncbi:unnamed protein product, partial [Mesorhabditis belari]|uniref:Uncharacterized protein n=1 Tax=Mesorhabditis belari TaxID=2138241 RepID=A0AAF3E961_9BILA